MATSHYDFRALPFEQQLPLVWVEGTFLARRWEEEDGVSLYHMDGGFFCEVYLEVETYKVVRVRTFTRMERLEDYACYVNIDDLTEPKR
ncbi:hypothetical protein I2I05_19065 [Hymenobacter sp. BT683]|uniref:Uncharacterized protein n=1 Tax=Hymenobacter jeongseonensis TaxID=2791027 RepID=A0ABS0IMR3_9BACT|nr:hypothetical protein [Hymenobacter jeongseonensis]MBF9239502.1 hypothetical protein [Hymenobacter jeongseonensis]